MAYLCWADCGQKRSQPPYRRFLTPAESRLTRIFPSVLRLVVVKAVKKSRQQRQTMPSKEKINRRRLEGRN